MKKLLCLLAILLVPATARAARVDNSEYLRLLNQATGKSSGSQSSFQARLDAILTPTADSNRSYVARQDTRLRQQVEAPAEEEYLISTEAVSSDWEDARENAAEKDAKEDASAESRVDASEESYRKELQEMQDKVDRRLQEFAAGKKTEPAAAARPAEGLTPSLANNPFYFARDPQSRQQNFTDNKPVIVSRLVQQGYPRLEAEGIVQKASSQEEMVMILMTEQGYNYGEALDLTRVS